MRRLAMAVSTTSSAIRSCWTASPSRRPSHWPPGHSRCRSTARGSLPASTRSTAFLTPFWHDDAATGMVGTTDVGPDTTLVGASPVGFVTLRNGLKVQETNVLTGQTSTLTDFTGGPDIPSVVLPGPLGVAIEYSNQVTGTSAVGYVHYSDPGHLEPVIAPTFGNLVCQSVTTNAVGCYLLGNGPLEVVRAP